MKLTESLKQTKMKQIKIKVEGINICLYESGKIELVIPKGMTAAKLDSIYSKVENNQQYKVLKKFAANLQATNKQPSTEDRVEENRSLIDKIITESLRELYSELLGGFTGEELITLSEDNYLLHEELTDIIVRSFTKTLNK